MPTDTPEAIAEEVLPCLHKRYGQYSCQPEEFAFLCVNCERRPAVADAIRREREAMPTDEAMELLERWVRHADAYGEGPSHLCETTRAYLARTAPEGREESVWSGTVDSENPRIASHKPPPRSSTQGAREQTILEDFRMYENQASDCGDRPVLKLTAEDAAQFASALAAERVRERVAAMEASVKRILSPDAEVTFMRLWVEENKENMRLRARLAALERVREAAQRYSDVTLVPDTNRTDIGVPTCEEHEALINALDALAAVPPKHEGGE